MVRTYDSAMRFCSAVELCNKLSKLGNSHLDIRKLLLQLNKLKHSSRRAKTSPDSVWHVLRCCCVSTKPADCPQLWQHRAFQARGLCWEHRAGEEEETLLGEWKKSWGSANGQSVKAKHPLPEGNLMPRRHRSGAYGGILVSFLQLQLKKLNKLMVGWQLWRWCSQRPLHHLGLVRGSDLQPGVYLSAFSMPKPFLFSASQDVCYTAGGAASQVLHPWERWCQMLLTLVSSWVKNHIFAMFLPKNIHIKICIWWMSSEISHPLIRQDYFGVQKVFHTSGRMSFSTVWKPCNKPLFIYLVKGENISFWIHTSLVNFQGEEPWEILSSWWYKTVIRRMDLKLKTLHRVEEGEWHARTVIWCKLYKMLPTL